MNRVKKLKLSRQNLVLGAVFVVITLAAAIVTKVILEKTQVHSKVNSLSSTLIVDIFADKIVPNTLTFKLGETVRFNNKDSIPHELSLGSGTAYSDKSATNDEHDHDGSFESGSFNPDEAWQATFKQAGTYFMHDHNHPDLNVLVVAY